MQNACDHIFAAKIAVQAGRLIRRSRGRLNAGNQDENRNLDRAADDLIRDLIRLRHPDDAILSEESVDNKNRLEQRRVWIVDPLDGSANCYRGGREWAVHVALLQDGRLAAGTICAPDWHQIACTGYPTRLLPKWRRNGMKIALSESHASAECLQLIQSVGASPIHLSSAGIKTLAVINGLADAYVHSGGQYEWDSAAPVAVAQSAGLHTSKLDGTPLQYNQNNPYVASLLICRPELAEKITGAYRKIGARETFNE